MYVLKKKKPEAKETLITRKMPPPLWNIVIPIAVSGSGHTRKQGNSLLIGVVIHKQESRHKVPKTDFRAVLGRMKFAFHATRRRSHGASRLVQAMSAWLVKTRRAPSRHSRDARVYGHTTTAMHKRSTPPPEEPKTRETEENAAYMYAHKNLLLS